MGKQATMSSRCQACYKQTCECKGGNPGREETSSGFAKGDNVVHSSRGKGKITGFYGEYVVCEFDTEPDDEFQYTHEEARSKLTFPDGSRAVGEGEEAAPPPKAKKPAAEKKPAAAAAPAAPADPDRDFKKGDKISHAARGKGVVGGFNGEFVVIVFDNEEDEFEYTQAECKQKL